MRGKDERKLDGGGKSAHERRGVREKKILYEDKNRDRSRDMWKRKRAIEKEMGNDRYRKREAG